MKDRPPPLLGDVTHIGYFPRTQKLYVVPKLFLDEGLSVIIETILNQRLTSVHDGVDANASTTVSLAVIAILDIVEIEPTSLRVRPLTAARPAEALRSLSEEARRVTPARHLEPVFQVLDLLEQHVAPAHAVAVLGVGISRGDDSSSPNVF